MARTVLLDSGPLGRLTHPRTEQNEEVSEWLTALVAAGVDSSRRTEGDPRFAIPDGWRGYRGRHRFTYSKQCFARCEVHRSRKERRMYSMVASPTKERRCQEKSC